MSKTLLYALAGLLCFSAGVSAGMLLDDRLDKPCACEKVDYSQIGGIVEKALKANAVQPFDVEKIKNVKGFTYAPQYHTVMDVGKDTAFLRTVIENALRQESVTPTKKRGLFR